MGFSFDSERRAFHAQTSSMSYVFMVTDGGILLNVYWGNRLPSLSCVDGLLADLKDTGVNPKEFLRDVNQEYRCQEPGDFAEPALLAVHADGVRSTRLRYVSHEISTHRLSVLLRDTVYPFEVELIYELWGDLDMLSRHSIIRNVGEDTVKLEVLKSATVSLPRRGQYRLTHFVGNWGAEFRRETCLLGQGQFVMESHRLTCAAHQHTPFVMLDSQGQATETMGEVYFGALLWTGDFKISCEQTYYGDVSLTAGINELGSSLTLLRGESFETPSFCLGYSNRGFERMSEILYDWQLDYLAPQAKSHAIRPIIYNSWYPYEFKINEDNILGLIQKAKDIGAELFVIDDGWMPKRSNDHAGLGDWVVDRERFPHGFTTITKACHQAGLLFGLWVEPEMCNPDSDIYRSHPEWVIQDATRVQSEWRNQVILDLSREDVCQWVMHCLDELIDTYQLDYLKWDMNRYASELGTDPALSIRYITNLYRIWSHLNERHPQVLYENCAAGGGRSDFGMVRFADRINRSDNAHPKDVMILHEGFSRLFVAKTAGGAGNIARDEDVPLDFRIHLGMTGSMSIGINLLTADQKTLQALTQASAEFKKVRGDLQDSYVYRIASAEDHPYVIWQYVRRDRKSFGLFAFAHDLCEWDFRKTPRFRLRGLLPDALYEDAQGKQHLGAELMNVGVRLPALQKPGYSSSFDFYRVH